MKKIVLTAAIAFAAFSAVNAQVNANDQTPGTVDNVTMVGTLNIVDMIDLVPEFQVAGNTADTWAEFENGLSLLEAWPNTPPGGFDIEFRVSATRAFKVEVDGANFMRVGGGDPGIPASAFTQTVVSAEAPLTAGAPINLSTSYQTFLTGTGCYNKMFVVNLALGAGEAYNHLGGTYTANIGYRATLVP